MAVLIPKFLYNSITFTPSFPPTQKPGARALEAQRNDSRSLSGLSQTVWWRTDEYLDMQFDLIPAVEVPSWDAMFKWGLQGGIIAHYPDATLAGFTDYLLDSSKTTLPFQYRGNFKTTFRLRRVIGSDQLGS